MSETYISIDIETTGPAPGLYSMISLGASAFSEGVLLDSWTANLRELMSGMRHPDTMAWWRTQPKAWELATSDPQEPGMAMLSFKHWLMEQPGKLVAVAWPAAFDFAFVNWYLHCFTNSNPLGFACVDLRSYAAGLLHSPRYYKLPEDEMRALRQTEIEGLVEHRALDDAIEQGYLWCDMLKRAKEAVGV